MTDDRPRGLSRRRILAGLGAVSLGAVGSGLGTEALFSDFEELPNNTLAAGDFDLKLDWEEHYFHDSDSARTGLSEEILYLDGDPADVPSDYVGLPTPSEPMVAVAETDLGTFMDNTAIEAYPDPDDDGIQDPFASEPGETTDQGVGYICEDGADTPDDLDPTGDGLRTLNDDTYNESTDEWRPLFALDDVKPGDSGETTFSFHLCNNHGKVWLTGGLVDNAENGFTEPEQNHSTDTDSGGELLDAIQTRIWYDDGDNVAEVGGDDPAWLTDQQPLRDLLDQLDTEPGIELCPGGDETGTACERDADHDSKHTTGEEVLVDGNSVRIGQNPKCSDFNISDGYKIEPVEVGTTTYDTQYGDLTITVDDNGSGESLTLTDWSLESGSGYCVGKVVVKGGPDGANVYSYDNPDGDDNFTDTIGFGAVSAHDTALQTPGGYGISHISFCFRAAPDPCCFEASTDHYLGLAWWLPPTVGNEVQSDSVTFGVGFFTDQCRNS